MVTHTYTLTIRPPVKAEEPPPVTEVDSQTAKAKAVAARADSEQKYRDEWNKICQQDRWKRKEDNCKWNKTCQQDRWKRKENHYKRSLVTT